jgi:hypothetical protein
MMRLDEKGPVVSQVVSQVVEHQDLPELQLVLVAAKKR